jgi:hypothetical protein
VGAELTVDHFHPRSRGGHDEMTNWIYCCHPCNEFKGDYWDADPSARILHPLRDNPSLHIIQLDDSTLQGLDPRGWLHIERLNLNRPALVAYRRAQHRRQLAFDEQDRLLHRLRELEKQLDVMIARLHRIEGPHDES